MLTAMNLAEADALAAQLVAQIAPFCTRCEVAGSVRRRKASGIKDIEICAIPRTIIEPGTAALFETPDVSVNLLWRDWAMRKTCSIAWIKTGSPGIEWWTPKADGRWWKGLIRDEARPLGEWVKLDLFLTTPDRWGATFAIRTGPWDFSKAIMIHARKVGLHFGDGDLWQGSRLIPTPDERAMFAALGLRWVEPEARTGPGAVAAVRGGGRNSGS